MYDLLYNIPIYWDAPLLLSCETVWITRNIDWLLTSPIFEGSKTKEKKKGHLISGNYHIWRQMAASQACDSTAKLLRHGWKAAESWWHLCTCIKSCNMLTRSFVHAWAKNGARLHKCKARLWNLPIKWGVWCYKTTNVHFKFNFWYMT